MAALSLDNGILFVRLLVQDQHATFQGTSDADITKIINDKYMTWYKVIERRVQLVTAITALSANPTTTSDASFVYPEIEATYLSPGSGALDVPLARMKWGDLWGSIAHDVAENGGTGNAGTPAMYAAKKLHGSAEKWTFLFWPFGSYTGIVKCDVRVYPTALSGTATPELGDAEGYWLYRIAAADIAQYIGRPELVEGILAPIPDAIRGKMGVERKRDDPKRRIETSVLG
jgi:hypothetical protein